MTPFDPKIVVARLLEKTGDYFQRIDVVPSVSGIPDMPELATPGAYVLYPEEMKNDNPGGMGIFAVTLRIGIAIVITRNADLAGEKSPPGHDIFPLVASVRNAMNGWFAVEPSHRTTAPVYESGGVEFENQSILIWLERWKVSRALKKGD